MNIIAILGWISIVLIPLLIFITVASRSLRRTIKEASQDGRFDEKEMEEIFKEANRFVKALVKYLLGG